MSSEFFPKLIKPQIYAYEDILLVSDAHQGRIIVLDKNLNYLKY